ncbi:MAG: hypothetical protein WBA35_06905, partial [Litorimonas sp.]
MGLKSIASRLLKRHGQPAVILRPGEPTEDALGTPIPGEDTLHPAVVLLASAAVDLEAFAGGQTALTDNRVLVSVEGLGIVPNTDDKLL